MAQVNVDLSEYDMLRQSKDKAEKEVTELKEEVKKLKDNAANVVVKNRYYLPTLNYKAAAARIIWNLGSRGMYQVFQEADSLTGKYASDPFGYDMVRVPKVYGSEAVNILTHIIEHSLSDMINWKASYRMDSEVTEVRGFDEMATQIQQKLETDIKTNLDKKQEELEIAMQAYDTKKLDIDKAVTEAEEAITTRYKKKLDKADEKIEELEKKLKEASKSSEEKLAEAMEKLKAAEAEVAKYQTPRKKLFGIF